MTHHFTLREAKARLSHLLDLAAAGEEIEIERKGGRTQRFRLVVVDPDRPVGRGALKGTFEMPDDFDDDDPEIVAMFEGEQDEDGTLAPRE